ncbi:hypothetical protein GCM10009092_09940 [Bowmanella denitrificans]|uniref:Uncharacterized protein n=1 Tax=Bowmanella denitrificans TaxID=366582 RepID=A0ABP3GKK3_9ALTE
MMFGSELCYRIRQAVPADIPAMSDIRLSVQQNKLADPGKITDAMYLEHIML